MIQLVLDKSMAIIWISRQQLWNERNNGYIHTSIQWKKTYLWWYWWWCGSSIMFASECAILSSVCVFTMWCIWNVIKSRKTGLIFCDYHFDKHYIEHTIQSWKRNLTIWQACWWRPRHLNQPVNAHFVVASGMNRSRLWFLHNLRSYYGGANFLLTFYNWTWIKLTTDFFLDLLWWIAEVKNIICIFLSQ